MTKQEPTGFELLDKFPVGRFYFWRFVQSGAYYTVELREQISLSDFITHTFYASSDIASSRAFSRLIAEAFAFAGQA